MAERLLALIQRRGRALEVGHIASQLLRLTACPERLQRRLVAEVVDSDPRLAWHGRDLVGIAPDGWGGRRVDQASFCIVDLETTGGAPGGSKITEIGAVRVEAMRIVDRFETLVDPGRPIPPTIEKLTGITAEMVEGAPVIDEVIEGFAEFVGDNVLVAHNAPFDLRFLNYERRRISGRYFTQPWLDTLVLSRRLLRGRIERHNLRSLAEWAGTAVEPCHRALPDAEATAEALIALIPLLLERGTTNLDEAVRFATPRVNRHAHKLALAEDLPSGPGVYLMKDAQGRVLYVGKAANLKRRVRSYFGPGGQHSRRIGRALAELERVDHEPLGSEFEALLREGELIRSLRPPCNSRGVTRRGRYLKLTVGELYPRLLVVDRPGRDDAAYFGPFRSARSVQRALWALQVAYPLRRCHPICAPGSLTGTTSCEGGPCSCEDPDRYGEAVAEVGALLRGEPGALGALPARLAMAAVEGRLDGDDEEHTECVAALLRVLAGLGRIRSLARLSAVVLEADSAGAVVNGFFIGGGRLVARAPLGGRGWREAVADGLERVAAAERQPFDPMALADVEVATLVDDRLREVPRRRGGVRLPPDWDRAEARAAVQRELRAVKRRRNVDRDDRAA
jgi:DNA polymerase-3 subunit epsilon